MHHSSHEQDHAGVIVPNQKHEGMIDFKVVLSSERRQRISRSLWLRDYSMGSLLRQLIRHSESTVGPTLSLKMRIANGQFLCGIVMMCGIVTISQTN